MSITAVAVLGGLGALPSAADAPVDRARLASASQPEAGAASPAPATGAVRSGTPDAREALAATRETALPEGSGRGRRVVFSEGRQRVWLVARGGAVERTYLVSGSIHDNLDPGTYSVYSRSEQAWGIDDSGSMRYFVRFAHGDNAAIGFHDIPIDEGRRVQGVADLGTPQSHGCIRQKRADARALWAFAPLGTTVVVTA
jgi:lipoprotein-anchoring transpeptidase ErfK/SrfK